MRNFLRMPNWRRLLVCLLLFACVCGAALIIYFGRRQGPFWEKYEKVQLGMTEEEVVDILGPPQDQESIGGGLGPHVDSWFDGQQLISIAFDVDYRTSHDAAYSKLFSPKSAWEVLRDFFLNPHGDWPPPG